MLFSSYGFLFQFLPVVALAFAVARRVSPRCGIWALAFASLIFYGAWKPVYLLLLLGLDRSELLARAQDGRPAAPPPFRHARRRAQSRSSVLFQIHQLPVRSLTALTGTPLPFVNVILPLGISFFTFQQIAYLVDVMRGAKSSATSSATRCSCRSSRI